MSTTHTTVIQRGSVQISPDPVYPLQPTGLQTADRVPSPISFTHCSWKYLPALVVRHAIINAVEKHDIGMSIDGMLSVQLVSSCSC